MPAARASWPSALSSTVFSCSSSAATSEVPAPELDRGAEPGRRRRRARRPAAARAAAAARARRGARAAGRRLAEELDGRPLLAGRAQGRARGRIVLRRAVARGGLRARSQPEASVRPCATLEPPIPASVSGPIMGGGLSRPAKPGRRSPVLPAAMSSSATSRRCSGSTMRRGHVATGQFVGTVPGFPGETAKRVLPGHGPRKGRPVRRPIPNGRRH